MYGSYAPQRLTARRSLQSTRIISTYRRSRNVAPAAAFSALQQKQPKSLPLVAKHVQRLIYHRQTKPRYTMPDKDVNA